MRFLLLFLISGLLFSCEHADPPLPGKRINVLHYDLLESEAPIKVKINIPAQMNIMNWNLSDIGQYTGLPGNISLATELKKTREFSHKNFSSASPLDSAAVIVSDILYTYSNTVLSASQISNGKNIWTISPVAKDERSDVLGGSIAYFNDVIYLSSGGRDFIAIDAKDGTEIWRSRLPNVINNIALVDKDQIYVTSTDNTISAFNLKGKLLWRHDAAIYSLVSSRLYIPAVMYDSKIIVITSAGDLIILNRYDGLEVAAVDLSTMSIIGDGTLAKGPIASPYLSDGKLYILTGENELIKINLEGSGIAWRQTIPSAKAFWVVNNTTYVLTENEQLIALEDDQGKMIWISDLSQYYKEGKVPNFYGPILAGNQLIITTSKGEFLLLSPDDGKLLLRNKTSISAMNRMPIIVNEKLYFIGTNGKIAIWE